MSSRPGSPPRRVLLALGAGVLALHVLVLQDAGARFGPHLDATRARPNTFATRTIPEITPPAIVAIAPPPVPVALPPVVKQKKLVMPVEPAEPATDLIAPSLPDAGSAAVSADSSTPTAAVPAADTPVAATSMPQPSPSAASAQAQPPALPETTKVGVIKLADSVRLNYTMTGVSKGLTYYANAALTWNNTGSQYDLGMEVSALFLGSRSMASTGGITPLGLAPARFLDKSRSEQAAHFQAEKGKVTFSANTPDAPWIEGAQDRVSLFMQLGGMLAGDPSAFPAGSSITVYTVGPREADTWTFLVEAEETLNLPRGEMATLKLSRKPRREFDQKVEIWFAPSLGYLPVRSRITQQNGDFVDQQLKDVIRP